MRRAAGKKIVVASDANVLQDAGVLSAHSKDQRQVLALHRRCKNLIAPKLAAYDAATDAQLDAIAAGMAHFLEYPLDLIEAVRLDRNLNHLRTGRVALQHEHPARFNVVPRAMRLQDHPVEGRGGHHDRERHELGERPAPSPKPWVQA
jgi:hypothetical protein